MGLFSDITSALGSVFGNNSQPSSDPNDPLKKKQNNIPTPTPVVAQKINLPTPLIKAPTPAPPKIVTPVAPAPTNTPSLTGQPIVPGVAPKPYSGGYDPNGPLQTQVHNIAVTNAQAPATSLDRGINTVADVAGRTAIGFLQAPVNLFDAVKQSPSKLGTSLNQGAQQIDQDQATNGIRGRGGSDIYKGLQIAGNVGTIIPGAAEAATHLPVIGDDIATQLNKIPGVSIGNAAKEAAPTITEAASDEAPTITDNPPPETGTKPVEEPKSTNSPSSETTQPTVQPGTTETGTKPVEVPSTPVPRSEEAPTEAAQPATITPAPVEATPVQTPAPVETPQAPVTTPTPEVAPAPTAPAIAPTQAASEAVAASPEQQAVVDEAPNVRPVLKKTGDPMTDLENAAQVAHHQIDHGTLNTPENLSHLLRTGSNGSKAGDIIGGEFQEALDKVLTQDQQRNVIKALQTGTEKTLTGDEAKVASIIKEHIYEPSNALRTARDPEYESDSNYSTQIQKGRGKSGVKSGDKPIIRGKNSVFDKLNKRGRFSVSRTTGKFTNGADVKYGRASDLGLSPKNDGTFVDKNTGKVYNFSHASNQELEDKAGMKFHNLSTTSKAHISDAVDLKYRSQAVDAMLNDPEKFNLSEVPTDDKNSVVTLKGPGGESRDLFTDANTQKSIDDSGLTNKGQATPSLPVRLWNKAQSIVLQSTIQNPIWHGIGNQGVQALIASGEKADGIGGLRFLASDPDPEMTLRRLEAGGNAPTMGKDDTGLLSKLTYGGSKTNSRMTAYLDNMMRDKLFKSFVTGKNPMSDTAAAEKVDQFLGDRHVVSDMQPHLDFFWHYYETMIKALGHTAADTVRGHVGVGANAAIAAGTIYAADKVWQKWTGNPGGYIHPFGEVGVASSLVGSLKDLAQHEYSNALTTVTDRVSPLLSQAAEQTLGVNSYGEKFQNGAQRVQNLSELSPAVGAFMSTGKSDAEKALNYLGVYTPHIKGSMATNNKTLAPILNTKGAKNDSSPGFPKDFTGEQGAKQYYAGVDKSLQGLSSHDTDVLKEYYDTQVNSSGQKVKTGVVGGYTNATNLVTNDDKGGQSLKHLYASQHSQKGNDPLWALPLYAPVGQPSVKNYLDIESQPEGYEKDGTIQKMQGSAVGTNGWYDKLNAERSTYYSQFPPSKDATDEPPYPVFNKQTTADISAADNITDPTKFSQYLDANPDVVNAFAATAQWTNQIRALEGKPPQEATIGVSPELTQIIKTYDALPASKTAGNTDSATNGERSAWINANPTEYNQMIQYFAQDDMRGVIENSIKAEYSGQGVNSQALLKDTKGAGSDIVENSNGTYSLNAPAASAATYGSGSGYESASTKAYEADKAAGFSDDDYDMTVKPKDTGLKADTKKYTPPKLLEDKAPTGKNGNPFVQTITTTKGVKQRKGGDNMYAANISNSKGVKAT